LTVSVAAFASALVFAGCGGAGGDAPNSTTRASPPVSPTPTHDLTGLVELKDAATAENDCTPPTGSGYGDIRRGTDVVLKDGAGVVVANGSLGTAYVASGNCVFPFTLASVPRRDFYTLALSARRGELHYSFDQLVGDDWRLSITLGQ
jgi:hypothetical protein